jgi:hypothetical protein
MDLQFYWLVLGVLSVWRVTHLLNAEDGPWNLVVRLRLWAGTGFWAGLLDCFNCLSLWIAAPVAYLIGNRPRERFFLWLALSGAAILLERVMPEETVPHLYPEDRYNEDQHNEDQYNELPYEEHQEVSHVLRQESTAASDANALPGSRTGPPVPPGI